MKVAAGAERRRIREALEAVASQLEPLEAAEPAFRQHLAASLAGTARAAAAAVVSFEAGRPRVLAQSAELTPERLAQLSEATAAGAQTSAGDLLAVPWTDLEGAPGAVVAFDSAGGGFTAADRLALEAGAEAASMVWRQRRRYRDLLTANAEEAARVRSDADRAIELEDMKRRFLNLAAHELRSPLAVIRGYLAMLADGTLDEGALRRVLPILTGKAAQMDALVTQMLEVARLEEGRLELKSERVDLGAICRQAVDVAGLIAPPGISVFLERPPGAIEVQGDGDRIANIIANLIDNAVKYTPEGGVVYCRAGVSGGQGFAEVTDHGLGIAKEDMPVLFTRFGRIVTPENSHIQGTGLGLHLSRELARMHGGDISVISEVGKGSTFTLWLPLAAG